MRNHLLSHSVAEVLLLSVSTHVLEWKNRQHDPAVGGVCLSPARPDCVRRRDQEQRHGERGNPNHEKTAPGPRWRREHGWGFRGLGNLVDSLHRSDEAIAAAGQGLDVTGLLGVIRERLTDLPDAEVQPLLEIHEGVAAPDFSLDLLSGNDLATVSGKQDQDFEGLPLQVDHPASPAQLGTLEI